MLFSRMLLTGIIIGSLTALITFCYNDTPIITSGFAGTGNTFNNFCGEYNMMPDSPIEKLEYRQSEIFRISLSALPNFWWDVDNNSYNHNIIKPVTNDKEKIEYSGDSVGASHKHIFEFQALSAGLTNLSIIKTGYGTSPCEKQYQIKVVEK